MYHGIVDDSIDIECWWQLKKSHFEEQIDYIYRHFEVISIDKAIEAILSQNGHRKNLIVLTFDDGYKSFLTHAYPLLNKYGFPSTVYIASGLMESNSLIWVDKLYCALFSNTQHELNLEDIKLGKWQITMGKERLQSIDKIISKLKKMPKQKKDEILAIIMLRLPKSSTICSSNQTNPFTLLCEDDLKLLAKDELVTIGSHSVNHEILTNLPLASAIQEISESKKTLEQITGKPIKHFAYPNGNYNENIIKELKNVGFRSAVTTDIPHAKSRDPFKLRRIGIGAWDDINAFRCSVSGISAYIKKLKVPLNYNVVKLKT